MCPIEGTGSRVRAREWRADDAEVVWRLSEQGPLFSRPGEITSLATAKEWLERQLENAASQPRARYRMAIELLDGATVIGGARIDIEDADNRQASLGMGLDRRVRGKGYGTDAASAMLELAFDRIGIHRVEALIDPANGASMRAAEKLRMRREGHMKGRILENGKWLDADVFALTEDEWRAR